MRSEVFDQLIHFALQIGVHLLQSLVFFLSLALEPIIAISPLLSSSFFSSRIRMSVRIIVLEEESV